MAVAERNHGTAVPADGVDDTTRGNHVLQGFANVAHEGVRAALSVDVGDIGRAVLQTGGAVPALYEARALGTGLDKWTQVGGSVTTQAVTLFVRTGVGSDAASGLTNGTSLATLAEAVKRVPFHIAKGHPVIIRLGAGAYPRPVWGTRIVSDHLVVVGDGAGSGNGFVIVIADEQADAGTGATQVVKVGGGMTPDEHRGKTIRITSGPGAGQRREIRENTATDFIPVRNFSVAPTAASFYEIDGPAASLTYSGAFLSLNEIEGLGQGLMHDTAQGTAPCYVLAQLDLTSADTVFVNYMNVSVAMYGVELSGVGSFNPEFSYASLHAGLDDFNGDAADIPNNLGLAASNTEWLGWGVSDVELGAGRSNFLCDMSVVYAYFVLAFFGFVSPNRALLPGGRLFGGVVGFPPIFATNQGVITTRATGTPNTKIDALTTEDAVLSTGSGRVILNDALVSAVTGALLRAKQGGSIVVLGTSTGTSSGGLAVDAREGGKVYLKTGGLPTFAGSPALDYEPGGGGAVAAAFFAANGDYTSSADGSVIQRAS